MMAVILTCIAAAAAVPAFMASDDELAVYLGFNALIWSSFSMVMA